MGSKKRWVAELRQAVRPAALLLPAPRCLLRLSRLLPLRLQLWRVGLRGAHETGRQLSPRQRRRRHTPASISIRSATWPRYLTRRSRAQRPSLIVFCITPSPPLNLCFDERGLGMEMID